MLILLCLVAGCHLNGRPRQAVVLGQDELDLLEQEYGVQAPRPADPLEGLNRLVFNLNDQLYYGLVDPAVRLYCHLVPGRIRRLVGNFFHNATTPSRLASCLVQGKVDEALAEYARFVINTSGGILGLHDLADDRLSLRVEEDEDMGQALAALGAGSGPYIVLPLLGSSTLRDSVGQLVDWLLNPLRYIEPWELYAGLTVLRTVNAFPQTFEQYQQVRSAAIEPYTAVRQSYIQHRASSLSR